MKKPEPKKGSGKVDALRAERERAAEEREARAAKAAKQEKCAHKRVNASMGDIGTCLDCGTVVRVGSRA